MEVLYGASSSSTTPAVTGGKNKELGEFVEHCRACGVKERFTVLRKSGDPGLLVHAIVDGIVDHFFEVVEFYEEQINRVHDSVVGAPKVAYTKTLHLVLKELTILRRKLAPTENLLTALKETSPENPFSPLTKTYFGDVLDHCLTILEELEAMEQSATSLLDLTFNMISHQTNESMKLLSVVSFVFLPTTFVAGVYGMNFDYFPELHYDLGFWYFWIWTTVIVVVTMIGSWKMGLLERA